MSSAGRCRGGAACPLDVVYLTHVARLSGAELAMAKLQKALGDRVRAHTILFEDGPLVDRLLNAGGTVEILPMHDSARDLRRERIRPGIAQGRAAGAALAHATRLGRRLRRLRPDLVHAHSLKAGITGGAAARGARVPFVWHVHDRIADDYLPAPAVRGVRAAMRLLPQLLVANSESTRATLPHRASVRIVSNAIEPVTSAREPATAVERVGIVGRLSPWKGQDVFLRAFAQAFPSGDVEAVVIGAPLFGEQEYERGLRALAEDLGLCGRVDFRGFRSDVVDELGRLDLMVHASVLPEPFGQVIVEAMAVGVPVVAARSGGASEIVTEEVDGLLHEPGAVEELAAALRRLAADAGLRRRLAAAGRTRAVDFEPEGVAQVVMTLYRELLRAPGRG